MGSSLGFLLSLFFCVQIVAYVGDIASLQFIYSSMESVATTIGHMIAIDGGITARAEEYAKDKIYAFIQPLTKVSQIGEIYEFVLYKGLRLRIVQNLAKSLHKKFRTCLTHMLCAPCGIFANTFVCS